jgi:hypothetical protein
MIELGERLEMISGRRSRSTFFQSNKRVFYMFGESTLGSEFMECLPPESPTPPIDSEESI